MEKVDEVFIWVDGFFPNKFLREEVGVGWGSGDGYLYNFSLLVVVRGSISVIWDINRVLCPINQGVYSFHPGSAEDDVFISTVDDVE